MPSVLVLGLGLSGRAAVELLLKKGYCVVGMDDQMGSLEPLSDLIEKGMRVCGDVEWSEIEQLVVSPGVSSEHPVYREALERVFGKGYG